MLLLLVLGDGSLGSPLSLNTFSSFITYSYVLAYINLPVPERPQVYCNVGITVPNRSFIFCVADLLFFVLLCIIISS